ncbi:MAG: hypothetical protein WBF79_05170 [Rhodococcus sp. (in: high G+C Gram-positive bacteria)]
MLSILDGLSFLNFSFGNVLPLTDFFNIGFQDILPNLSLGS